MTGDANDVHFPRDITSRKRDNHAGISAVLSTSRVACIRVRARARTLFKTMYNQHQPERTSHPVCVLKLQAFSRATAAAPLSVSVSRYRLPLSPTTYQSLRLSLSLYIYLLLSLSPLSASLPANGGFSARTRRRGSIIHHTNSPESGRAGERVRARTSGRHEHERADGLADKRLGGEAACVSVTALPRSRAPPKQRGNAHAAPHHSRRPREERVTLTSTSGPPSRAGCRVGSGRVALRCAALRRRRARARDSRFGAEACVPVHVL